MLHRLAPLALVFVACSKEVPDYSACRLVGRWKVESTGSHPYDREGFSARGLWFAAETGSSSSNSFAHWTLIEDRGDRLVLEIDASPQSAQLGNAPQVPARRTFVFDAPDAMHEVSGTFDGVKYVRMSELEMPSLSAPK